MQVYRGTVTAGLGKAGVLGFPTLNIPLADRELSGSFAGTVAFDGQTYNAALYADQERKILEAHLLNFEGEIREGEIEITPLKKIREKEIFDNYELLKSAIEKDVQEITRFFEETT